jgi:ABC-type amino acid transport substrate-binding protein
MRTTYIVRLLSAAAISLAMTGVATAQGKIQEIKDRGTIRVAFAESIPMQFKDPKTNEWKGYNVDMAKALAEVLEVELEQIDAQWSTLIPGLMSDKWDICMVDMWATPKRAQTVVFTDPYFVAGWKLAVNTTKGLESWEDLNQQGRVIVAISGTADEQMARENFPEAEVRALVTDNVTSTFLEVANGRADAILTDELNIRMFKSRNPQAPVDFLEPDRTMRPTGFAYAIQPGDYHYLNFLNTWISSVLTGGLADEKKKEWLEDFEFPKE